jgi:ClpP class serine protease
MTPDSVNALGRGQVWTGTEAVGNGLADGIGGFHEALDELRRACRIGRGGASIIVYPEKRNLLPELSDLPSMATRLAARIFGGRENLAVTALTESEHIFFCMPYNIEIE